MQIYFVLLSDCNLHCSHCIRRFSGNINKSIELEEMISVLEGIAKIDSKSQIILTGGEPTLHKNFFDIIEIVQKYFNNVAICSNGIYSKKVLNKLSNLKNVLIQISIDGTRSEHDKIRGVGTFERSIGAIKKLIEHSVPVCISTTVNNENISSMIELAELFSPLKITKWKVALEQAFTDVEEKRLVGTEDWNCFVDKLLLKATVPLKIQKMFDFTLFKKMEKKLGKDFIKARSVQNCGCCTSKMYIYPDLSVKVCTCMDSFVLGNLKEKTYSEIIGLMREKKKNLAVKENSPCFRCEWLYLCNGGCPGYSKYYFGEIGYGDKRCPKVKAFYGL